MLDILKIFKSFENDYKGYIMEVLEYNFNDTSLIELIDFMEDGINDRGAIDEVIESQINNHHYYLRVWAVDNYDYIEQSINEFGMPVEFDWHKAIQLGQYCYFSKVIRECISQMVEHIHENYKV